MKNPPWLQAIALLSALGAQAAPLNWHYGYDAMGRPTIVLDPNGNTTYTYYDSLGRPIQTQQPANTGSSSPTIITGYSYNTADGLTQVTDPRSLATSYAPNGLGNVTSQSSPDTGGSQYTFDAKGNRLAQTDARGKTTSYTYDTLDRVTRIAYPTGVATALEYDGGATPNPAESGELTKITDESGQTSYSHDSLGRLITKTSVIVGKSFTTQYSWGNIGVDPYARNVSLLIHGDNGIVDSSMYGATITANSVTVTTSKAKVGTSSLAFTGSGSYLSIPSSSQLDLVGNDFTIEGWIYPTRTNTFGLRIFSAGGGYAGWNSVAGLHYLLQLTPSNALQLNLSNNTASPVYATSVATVPLNTWTYIAAGYKGATSSIQLSVNGAVESYTVGAVARPSYGPVVNIGSVNGENGSSSYDYAGYIDEFRVTKGVSRYTTPFVPPLAPPVDPIDVTVYQA